MNNVTPEVMKGLIQDAWIGFYGGAILVAALMAVILFALYKTRKQSEKLLKFILIISMFLLCGDVISKYIRLKTNPEAFALKSMFKR